MAYVPTYHDLGVMYCNPNTTRSCQATVHWVEAGNPDLPKIVLLHGFPSSSFQYREFIPMLADQYHVLAPDYPSFGLTTVSSDFSFTFANITSVIAAWLMALNVTQPAIYIQDFGAPVGLRLALTNAIQPAAIISQNGNAYVQGLGPTTFGPLMQFWRNDSQQIRQQITDTMLTLNGTKQTIVKGTPDKDLNLIDPEAWYLPYYQNIEGSENAKSKLDLLYDYQNNVELYPEFQKYFRDSKVPILAVWAQGDPSFLPAGAEAFLTDSPSAVVHLLDAGHFALETARWEIARIMRQFLSNIGY